MARMIQIRNVPDELHRRLKARAAERGLTLFDYLLGIAEREAEAPSFQELTERIRSGPKARLHRAPEVLRELRDVT